MLTLIKFLTLVGIMWLLTFALVGYYTTTPKPTPCFSAPSDIFSELYYDDWQGEI